LDQRVSAYSLGQEVGYSFIVLSPVRCLHQSNLLGSVEYKLGEGSIPFVFSWNVPFLGDNASQYSCGPQYRIGKEESIQSKCSSVMFSIHDPFEGDYRDTSEKNKTAGVLEAPIVYDTWKLELQRANRSLLASLTNSTKYTLIRHNDNLVNGIWRCPPPQEIGPGSEADFGAESHGLTGTSGDLSFKIVDKSDPNKTFGDINFVWSVPLIGKNSFSSNVFSVVPQVDGSHAVVSLLLTSDETFLLEIDGGSGLITSTAVNNYTGNTGSRNNNSTTSNGAVRFKSAGYEFDNSGNNGGQDLIV